MIMISVLAAVGKDQLMTRWIQHWQALPVRNRIGAALCMAMLIASLAGLIYEIGAFLADMDISMG